MGKNFELFVTVGGAFIGSLVGTISLLVSSYLDRRLRARELQEDKLKRKVEKLCKQYVSFYNLELLYLDEIKNLKEKMNEKCNIKGVQTKLRQELYKKGYNKIEYTASAVEKLIE